MVETLSADMEPHATPGAEAIVAVRPYTSRDAEATWTVFSQAINRTASFFYTPEQIEAWCPGSMPLDQWDARRQAAWTMVATVDDQVVGFSDLTDRGELDMLFVHPDAGRRGVARALVTRVLQEALTRGMSRVDTRASRAAQPAFERFGFVVDRENLANIVRGVVVANVDMHVTLPCRAAR